jgi:predicted RNA-binding Zn-ribbon protein involved in translation (DUF1610 family)
VTEARADAGENSRVHRARVSASSSSDLYLQRNQSMREPQCPKCNGEMTRGFMPMGGIGCDAVEFWYEGEPEVSHWTGLKIPKSGGIPVGAFRCPQCGYLEFYANMEFAGE